MEIKFIVENDNIRLSDELKLHISRRLYRSIKCNNAPILVNGVETKTFLLVNKGDEVSIIFDKNREINWDLYDSNLKVYFEDDNYLIVYKKEGILSIPTKAFPYSLYQEVIYYLKNKNESTDISILNRLDKETKGLVLVAKNPYAASLISPVHEHIERRYIALCNGVFEKDSDRIITKIKKSDDSNKRIISDDGQIAISNYRVLKRYDDKTLVEFILETGRTHQIRVHSKYLNHPIIGDPLYSDGDGNLSLTSYYIKFNNPFNKKDVLVILEEYKKYVGE